MKLLRLLGRAAAVALLALAVALGACALLPAATASLEGPDPIAALERIRLGGVEQALLLRGRDRANPVLLFVHGGPGMGMLPLAPHCSDELERHFVVVHWDQRGAGASCTDAVPPESLTLERIVADAIELSERLGERFGGPILLLGHSWGSIVGVHAVQQRPDLYRAYVGLGQLVHGLRNEELSWEFTRREAERRGDQQALDTLRGVAPPYVDTDALLVQRIWLFRYGGVIHDFERSREALWPLLFGREYTLGTRLRLYGCMEASVERLWDAVEQTDLFASAPRLDVPVTLILGREDYDTPFELASAWADVLEAPSVDTIWLDGVAHMAPIEAPEAFQRALIERLRAGTP